MSRVVFSIENHGNRYIAHWLLFIIAGLRHIKKYDIPPPNYIFFESKNEQIFEMNFNDFQLETLEMIKDKFICVKTLCDDDIVIKVKGEPISNGKFYMEEDSYKYVRELLTKNVIITDDDIKKYQKTFYLGRNRSHLLPSNTYNNGNRQDKRRYLINESDLIEKLQSEGAECIFLEDYNMIEKIKMFKLAKTIISPYSGALTFTLFSNSNTKIIELSLDILYSGPVDLYKSQCECFNINFNRYICNRVDKNDINDTMSINIDDFLNFYKKL